jgi:hypothetical protein
MDGVAPRLPSAHLFLHVSQRCDSNDDPAGVADNCITFNGVITNEESVFTRSVNEQAAGPPP